MYNNGFMFFVLFSELGDPELPPSEGRNNVSFRMKNKHINRFPTPRVVSGGWLQQL